VNGDSFVAGEPHLWSPKLPRFELAQPPALMPDGKHLITIVPGSETAPARQTDVNFLVNFGEELQRRSVVGK
jgi:hypothetical protein